MVKNENNMSMHKRTKFGLVGKNIAYSFSRTYFREKFEELGLNNFSYANFDIPEIEEFPFLLYHKEHEYGGLNVTIPYKEAVMPYLDSMELDAKKIGAVNTIKVTKDFKLVGYNTDVYGFQKSIEPLLKPHHNKALILGTGGASKAIAFAFDKMGIFYKHVSRNKTENNLVYHEIDDALMKEFTIIINTTPLGTFPNINNAPNIPFQFIGKDHLLFDLIYNPAQTKFLTEGSRAGATTKNGYEMLCLQAEKSWEIWNS